MKWNLFFFFLLPVRWGELGEFQVWGSGELKLFLPGTWQIDKFPATSENNCAQHRKKKEKNKRKKKPTTKRASPFRNEAVSDRPIYQTGEQWFIKLFYFFYFGTSPKCKGRWFPSTWIQLKDKLAIRGKEKAWNENPSISFFTRLVNLAPTFLRKWNVCTIRGNLFPIFSGWIISRKI